MITDVKELTPMLKAALEDHEVMENLAAKSAEYIMGFMKRRGTHEARSVMLASAIHFTAIMTTNALMEFQEHEGHDCAMSDPLRYVSEICDMIKRDIIESIRENAKREGIDIPGGVENINKDTYDDILEEFGIDVSE